MSQEKIKSPVYPYELTLRQLFKTTPRTFLKLITGSDLADKAEFLDAKFEDVKSRIPDLILRLPDDTIFHMEIQSANDPEMHWRMLEYYALIHRAYGKEPRQILLYVGNERVRMKSVMEMKTLSYRYEIFDIRDLDANIFLSGDSPAEYLLSILCRYDNPESLIREVARRIANLDENGRDVYFVALNILGRLRRFDIIVKKEVEHMPIVMDLNEIDYFHKVFLEVGERNRKEGHDEGRKEGLEEGMEKGIEKGIEKGMEKGIEKGLEASVVRLRKKHGYSVEQIADLLSLDEGFVRSALKKAGII